MANIDYEAAIRKLYTQQKMQQQVIDQLSALQRASQDAPKWVEQIPGRRVPYIAPIDLTIAADSTSKVSGTYTVSADGPFVITGIGCFFQKTSGAYANQWGYATTAGAHIAPTQMQLGFERYYDHPAICSGDVEITDQGSDRLWQKSAIASALFSPETGGVYVLPVGCLIDTNSVIEASFTPGVALTNSVTGKVQILLLGYKIVQGSAYQP